VIRNSESAKELLAHKAVKSDEWKGRPLRVAVYYYAHADDGFAELDFQRERYKALVESHPNWALVDAYPEDWSAYTRKTRPEFQRLMADAEAGRLDLIVAQSLARFGRNLVECLSMTRTLLRLDPVVGVYFATEGFCSLQLDAELIMSLMLTLAMEESERKSAAAKMAWRIRKEREARHEQ
jgi:DNA invertase Pin-like site-specific DNA recombinase